MSPPPPQVVVKPVCEPDCQTNHAPVSGRNTAMSVFPWPSKSRPTGMSPPQRRSWQPWPAVTTYNQKLLYRSSRSDCRDGVGRRCQEGLRGAVGISQIRPDLDALSARGAPFLKFPRRGEISPNVGALGTLCHGDIEASDPNLAGQQSSGLRIAGGLRERGDVVLVTDASARIRGLAREAPLVIYGRAYANDFVGAVLTNLVRPPDQTRQVWQATWLQYRDRQDEEPSAVAALAAGPDRHHAVGQPGRD